MDHTKRLNRILRGGQPQQMNRTQGMNLILIGCHAQQMNQTQQMNRTQVMDWIIGMEQV